MTAEAIEKVATGRKRPPIEGRDTLSRQLRELVRRAIERDGTTAHALARAADLDPKVLARFLDGASGVTLSTADRIAAALNLRLGEGFAKPARAKPKASRAAKSRGRAAE